MPQSESSKKKMLLLSGSRVGDKTKPGGGYLEFAMPMIREHFEAAIKSGMPVLFVAYAMPYPMTQESQYANLAKKTLEPYGIKIISTCDAEHPQTLLDKAAGIFIGGGNTYRLLDKLQQTGMLEAIREKINDGLPYLGSSAGTIIACPTIATTNDMHSRIPASLHALGALHFQLNCHYMDDYMFPPEHNGEPRSTRIAEYLRENRNDNVLGIREGSAIKVEGDKIYLMGSKTARLFKYAQEPIELEAGGNEITLAVS